MDLNHFYSEHQRSLMRAGATTSRLSRTRHLAAANLLAFRIRKFLVSQNAAAAGYWTDGNGYNGSRAATPAARAT